MTTADSTGSQIIDLQRSAPLSTKINVVYYSKCIESILTGLSVDEIMKRVKVSRLRKATPEQVRDALDGELTDSYRCILSDIQDHIAFLHERVEKFNTGSQASLKLNILMPFICCNLSLASAKKLL